MFVVRGERAEELIDTSTDEGADQLTGMESGRVLAVQTSESHQDRRDHFGAEQLREVSTREAAGQLEESGAGEDCTPHVVVDGLPDEMVDQKSREETAFTIREGVRIGESVEIDPASVSDVVANSVGRKVSL